MGKQKKALLKQASKTKKINKNEKVQQRVLVIQIVNYCCTKCSAEEETVKMCKECGAPMKVVEVVEKYGAEARDYLKKHVKEEGTKIGIDSAGAIAGDGVEDDWEADTLDTEIEDEELDALGGALFNDMADDTEEKRQSTERNSNGALLSDVLDEEDDENLDDLFGEEGLDDLGSL